MIKPETTLLFHGEKVHIFFMIWVDFLTRQGRKLQLPFMSCLAPFPGRIFPFPAPPFSSGTGSAAPGDQTEHCGAGRGNASWKRPGWDRALPAVGHGALPHGFFGLAGGSSKAAPFAGGSTEDRQPGTLRECGCPWPTRASAGGEPDHGLVPHRPAARRSLELRLSSTKLNYNGCDYNDISLPRSACSRVKGSVLERGRGAAIHTRELTVLWCENDAPIFTPGCTTEERSHRLKREI